MFQIGNKKVKIFTDGANLDSILKLANDPLIDRDYYKSHTNEKIRSYKLYVICKSCYKLLK